MSAGFWGFITFVWIALAVIGGLLEETVVTAQESGLLRQVMEPDFVTTSEIDFLLFKQSIPVPNLTWGKDLFELATFDFSYFSGDFGLVRWMLLLPLAMPVIVFGLVQLGSMMFGALGSLKRFI